MTELIHICDELLNSVPAAKNSAIIGIEKRQVLAASHVNPDEREDMSHWLLSMVEDLFCGKIAEAFDIQRDAIDEKDSGIAEFQIATDHSYYYLAALPNKPDYILVLITGKDTSFGLGWSAVRQATLKMIPLLL